MEGNGGGAPSKAARFQVSKAVKDGEASAGTERMSAILNKRVRVYFSVDTMASKSVVTEGTLGELQLEMPVATQRLQEAVRFQFTDNSEVVCSKIAYMDFAIATAKHFRPIELRAVPLFVLPGPKGDILLGKAQQEELGLTPTTQLMAQAAAPLRGAVTARDPLDINGRLLAAAGEPIHKLMRLTMAVTKNQGNASALG